MSKALHPLPPSPTAREYLEGRTDDVGSCPFCLEIADPSYSLHFLPPDWPFADRVICRSGSAIAMAGYGPQVYPYVLVVTHRHIDSLAECTPAERASVIGCLDRLLGTGLFRSNSLSVFEHGDCGGRQQHSCLDHCHLHVIDGSYPISTWVSRDYEGFRSVRFSAPEKLVADGPYLFTGTYDGSGLVNGIQRSGDAEPSQFFRRLLAWRTHQSQWNWRYGMNAELMRRLITEARSIGLRG